MNVERLKLGKKTRKRTLPVPPGFWNNQPSLLYAFIPIF
uniref:Uncharacterized protein n=1 Tax=Medicago truncatula TaxID=3880 RepID=I3S9D8_MEDTR|nr:unknown [Medicago truncatula]